MKKIIALFVVMFAGATSLVAQQDPHFSQFFDNTLFVNPAYAGSKDVLNITTLHREQWMGFEGRPVSTTLSIHSPLNYRSVGVGMTVVNDHNGPVDQTMVYGDFSYSLKFKNEAKLAFGLQGGFNVISIGTSGLVKTDPNDPHLLNNVKNNFNPNFGFGIYYHTPRWFVGVSSPKLLEQSYDGSTTNVEQRHYYANAGCVLPVNAVWKIRPMSQVKMTAGAPVSLDVSVTGIYREKLYVGALYRLNAAVGGFIQVQLNPQLKVGFASDFSTQVIRNYNYGTFEALLSYDFVFKKAGIRSPRYF
jgi:type IX secretion system PorP/SprF family membrane protein